MEPQGLAFAFAAGRLLVRRSEPFELPSIDTLGAATATAGPFAAGYLAGRPCYALAMEAAPDGLEPIGLRDVLALGDDHLSAVAARASQLIEWDAAHTFCGRCGGPTELHPVERLARACTACGALHFPRISPAVITLVHRPGEILLARNRAQTRNFYALIAGFVEPGETLEQAVAREIREEVGLEVTDVRYMGSQAWPFPSQLMVGFTAAYRSGDIVIQESEIADARWFPLEALPESRPSGYSIAGRLIERFLSERRGSGPPVSDGASTFNEHQGGSSAAER